MQPFKLSSVSQQLVICVESLFSLFYWCSLVPLGELLVFKVVGTAHDPSIWKRPDTSYRSKDMFGALKRMSFLRSVVHTKRLFQVLMILRALLMFLWNPAEGSCFNLT